VTRPSIFEFAGGEPAFQALAVAHHERCLADPELNHPFSHPGHPQHVARLGAYWAEVFGGPSRYPEGHSGMLEVHARQGAGADFGSRFVEAFAAAIADVGLPEDRDFRACLRDYMRWAVQEVLDCSPPDAEVPPDLPMPRWSWDGLQEP
jgi:hemoglobin